MHSTLNVFPCDLDEPILVPGVEDFEAENESMNRSDFGKPSVRSQSQEVEEEWEDIT
jgi:hypothetical protein